MLRAWTVNCSTSNEKKSWRGISVYVIRRWFTYSKLSIETDHTILPNVFNHCVIANFRFCPTIAWITSISIDIILFFFYLPRQFFAGFRSWRAATLTWSFIKFHVVSGDISPKGVCKPCVRMLFTYSYV
jgi:hypothetical protein